jgi:hypothetical protein
LGMNARIVVKRGDGAYDSFQVIHSNDISSKVTKRAGELLKSNWQTATAK